MVIAILGAFAIVGCQAPGTGGGGGGGNPGGGIGPAAVDLKTAGNYVIFSQAAVTDVPTSSITGDIGASPVTLSSITGFTVTPVLDGATGTFATAGAELVGKIYTAAMTAPTPATVLQAKLDMQAAYNDAATRTHATGSNLNLLGGVLPAGTTLAPGLYTWGTGVHLTGDITFSGGANDTWLMQISGTLLQDAGFKVILTGGALAKNIVWQVASTGVTLSGGAGSSFNGIILCLTQITTQTGATVHGRLLAQTAVTLGASTVTAP